MTLASPGCGCRPPVRISAMRPSSMTTAAFSFGCGVRQSMTFALVRMVRSVMQLELPVDFHRDAARQRDVPHRAARVLAVLRPPQLEEEIGRAVDHLRLLRELRRAVAHAEEAQHALH